METILESFYRNASDKPERVAFVHGDKQLSFGELGLRSMEVACGLLKAGIVPGMQVGILVTQGLHFPVALIALWRIGAIVVPFDPGSPAEDNAARESIVQLEYMIVDAEVSLARTSTRLLRFDELSAAPGSPLPALPALEDDCLLMFTSGTTGYPKALIHTHRSLAVSINTCMGASANVVRDDVVLATTPLQLAIGMRNVIFAPLVAGATVILVQPFSPRIALQAALRGKATAMVTVPAVLKLLADLPEAMGRPAFRCVYAGAAMLDGAVYQRFHARFGLWPSRYYAMSETGVIASTVGRVEETFRAITGWPQVELRLLDDDGREVAPGEQGEVAVRSDSLCRPYCLTSGGVREPLPMREGFFLTGDVGRFEPDGALMLVGRKKAFINGPRLRVNSREVEEVLLRMPGVHDCAVVAAPGRHGYEDIHAYVVADATVGVAEITGYCTAHLSTGKRPHIFDFIETIPRNSAGKVQSWRLREAPRRQ